MNIRPSNYRRWLRYCGPEVAENLTKVVDKLLRTRLAAEEKLKEKQNLYSRPKTVQLW